MASYLLILCAAVHVSVASMPSATTDQNSAKYWEGTAPLIIFTQVDGSTSHTAIPDRLNGFWDSNTQTCSWNSVSSGSRDSSNCRAYTTNWAYTKEIAECLYQTIDVKKADGTSLGKPYLIMNNLKRIKLDSDREINEAAQQDANAILTFNQIHTTFTNTAVNKIKNIDNCGFGGLLIDITGTSSSADVHFRYKLTRSDINQNDAALNNETDSSIKDLIEDKGDTVSDAIRGDNSLSKIFQNKIDQRPTSPPINFDVLPPTSNPTGTPSSYLSGNEWTLQAHGSQNSLSETDAIQIALHSNVRTGSINQNRDIFCTEFSAAIVEYMQYWYSSKMTSCNVPTPSPSSSPTYPSGSSYHVYQTVDSSLNYTGYRAGDAPLIILSSHGGNLKPNSIDDRLHGCRNGDTCIWKSGSCPSECWDGSICTRDSSNCKVSGWSTSAQKIYGDSKTQEIATCVYNKIVDDQLLKIGNTVFKPHLVVNNLHRSKVDTNREINEGAQQNSAAETAWKEIYEKWIPEAAQRNKDNCDIAGLVLDVHGQATNEFIHLGYLLSKSEISKSDTDLLSELNEISIKSLINGKSGSDIVEAVRGDTSLTEYIDEEIVDTANAGIETVPIRNYPYLAPTPTPSPFKYYSGGNAASVFGSQNPSSITDAIQIEIPSDIRKNNNGKSRDEFCTSLADAIVAYVKNWYDLTQCKTYTSANQIGHFTYDVGIKHNNKKHPPINPINPNPSYYVYLSLKSPWIVGFISLICLLLSFNIAIITYFNCCKNKRRGRGYVSVKQIDSEFDSEAQMVNNQ